MRRFVTLTAGITLALTVSAQTFNQLEVPRPQAPGIEYSIAKNGKLMAQKQMTPVKPLSAPKYEVAPSAPRLKESAADVTTQDTILVVGKKQKYLTYKGYEENRSHTITYDKYGRRATYTTYNSDGTVSDERKYTYEVGPFNYWTTKYVQVKNYRTNNEWADWEKEEREIDENKNITHKKTYTRKLDRNFNEEAGKYEDKYELVLTHDVTYDYSHAFLENGVETRGAISEEYQYSSETGELIVYRKYQWSDLAKAYVLSKQTYYNQSKMDTEFGEDFIKETNYRQNEQGEWVRYQVHTKLYENGEYVGYKNYSYEEDGVTIYYVDASKRVPTHDSPEPGWTSLVTYNYDEKTDTFIPYIKQETMGTESNFDGSVDNYAYKSYTYNNGEWVLGVSITKEILDGLVYKTTQEIGSQTYVTYEKLDENHMVIGTVEYNNDKSYQVVTQSTKDEESDRYYSLMYYYDANNNLIKTIRREDGFKTNVEGNYIKQGSYTYYELKDGKWELVKEYSVKEGSYMGYEFTTVYQFTDEGYPSTITEYAKSTTGGKDFINEKTVYTYVDNGYKEEVYSVWSPTDFTLQLDEYSTYYILADGGVESTNVVYDDEKKPGTIAEGRRYVNYDDGSYINYTYSKKTKDWVETSSYKAPFQDIVNEYLEDGTRITTTRKQGDNGEVINISKEESRYGNYDDKSIEMKATYTWDEANNEWVGIEKNEKCNESIEFGKEFIDPIDNYTDEYMPHDAVTPYTKSYFLEASKYYNWDATAKDWKVVKKEGMDNRDYTYQIDGNKLTIVRTLNTDDSNEKSTEEIVVNGEGYLTSDTETTQRTELDGVPRSEYKTAKNYTFNKYGLIEQFSSEDYSDGEISYSNSYIYLYEDAQIIPTLIEQLPLSTTAKGISVEGLTIRHDGSILLYNAEGRLAARGNGFVIAPQAGLYVIKTEGQTVKMVMK